jgi:hypothetical protein
VGGFLFGFFEADSHYVAWLASGLQVPGLQVCILPHRVLVGLTSFKIGSIWDLGSESA